MRQLLIGLSVTALLALSGCAELQGRPNVAVGTTTTTGAVLCNEGFVATPAGTCAPAQKASDAQFDVP